MSTIQPSESITTGGAAAVSLNPDNLHHEFRSLGLLVTMTAIISHPAQYYPRLEVDIDKADAVLNRFATETTGIASQSSVMHAMTNILVVDTEMLAGMNYAGDRPRMLIAAERGAVTRNDVVYLMDVDSETLRLAATPDPDLDWGVGHKDQGCVRGPSGNCLWDKVKASNKGFYLIDADIR
jgi:hypothetical protein